MTDVVVRVDGSEGAAEALIWAAREAVLQDLPLTAVMAWGVLDQHHAAVSEPFDPAYSEADALAALDAAVASTLDADRSARVRRRVVCDLAARALLDTAADGHHGLSRVVLGSVAMRIAHKATCPVLVVPASMPAMVT